MTSLENNGSIDMMRANKIAELEFKRQLPICPKTGSYAIFDSDSGLYKADSGGYSITKAEWDVISLHATCAQSILEDNQIEAVSFKGVSIDTRDALQPAHLLPHLVIQAAVLAKSAGTENFFALTVESIDEEALNAGNTLLDEYVVYSNYQAKLSESLQIICAATVKAVKRFRQDQPSSAVMNSRYIFDYKSH